MFVQVIQEIFYFTCINCIQGVSATRLIKQVYMQDSLRGGTNDLVNDIVSFIHAGDEAALAKAAVTPPRRRLVPEFLLKLARKISPF